MNRPKSYILLLLAILCTWLSACTDSDVISSDGVQSTSGRIRLRLIIPALTEVQTRANTDESGISSLYVVAYKDGTCCVSRTIDTDTELVPEEGNSGAYTLTLDFDEEVSDIHLVANAGDLESKILGLTNSSTSLDKVFQSTIGENLLLWGHVEISSVKNGAATVSLLRNVAKASITVEPSLSTSEGDGMGFTIEGWGIENTANKGSVAPEGYNSSASTANCTTDETFAQCVGVGKEYTDTDDGITNGTGPLYFYETPADGDKVLSDNSTAQATRIIIKAKHKRENASRYYTALFLDKETGNPLTLLRNHHYELKVVSVGKGYATRQEAEAAPAGNIKLEIKDHNALISELISNGAYDLGVCDVVIVDAKERTYGGDDYKTHPINQIAYFVTMWGDQFTEQNINFNPSVEVTEGSDWLIYEKINDTYTISKSDYNSSGKGYIIKFTCAQNPKEEMRRGVLTVTFGELSLPIVIEQEAANLKEQRASLIFGLPGDDNTTGRNYYKFLMEEVSGVKSTDMGGKGTRANGLHLGIGSPTERYQHNYWYKIEKADGDQIVTNDDRISVDENGTMTKDGQSVGCYVITVNDPTDATTWTGDFAITTKEGITITYHLYHTGIFQKEEGTNQPPSRQRTGWYYYELVTEQSGVSLLDRNLGATSVDDAGGYYLLKTGDKTADIADVCPAGYTRPPLSFWEPLMERENPLVSRERYDENGNLLESYLSWEALAQTDNIGTESIRFPRGGYCIGDELYNGAIGYYWSTTPVSGNQGFDSSAPEYGLWYRIARFSTDGQNISSVRYADGSNGSINEPYRYMSVRCVRNDEHLTADKNLLTIIDKRTSTKPLYIYISTKGNDYRNCPYGELLRPQQEGGGEATEATLTYEMIDPDVIKESIDKPLYIHFRQGGKLVNAEGFDSNECEWLGLARLIGEDRKFIVTDTGCYPSYYRFLDGNEGNVGDMDMGGDNWDPNTDQGNSMDMGGETWD